jgi:hypothetical protein
VTLDQIMHKSYDLEYDSYDWYLLPAEKAICKRESFDDRVQRKLKGKKSSTKTTPSNKFSYSHALSLIYSDDGYAGNDEAHGAMLKNNMRINMMVSALSFKRLWLELLTHLM